MIVTKVRNKIIPATIIASTMALGNVKAQKQTDTISVENKIENISEKTENSNTNTVSWRDIIFGLTLGTIGGTIGSIAVNKIKKQSKITQNTAASDNYFTEQFKNDSKELETYLRNLRNNLTDNNVPAFDRLDFDQNTQKFITKYPSRANFIKMFSQAYNDNRLNSDEKFLLCAYLEENATATDKADREKHVAAGLYGPLLDGIEDYETLLKVFRAEEDDSGEDDSDEGRERGSIKSANGGNGAQPDKTNLNYVHHNLKFKDVGGQDEAIKELKENILFPIKYPSAFKHDSMNNCFVLYGPPGCGKTLIAEALVNESNAYFVKLGANDLTSKWIGETEENWRNLFKDAIENQPSIIFIDEFDGIAATRGQGDVHNDKVVNQLLGLVSDIEKNNYQIFIIATTNRLDMIDKAILRDLRFGMHIELKPPQNTEEVKQILEIHLNKKPHEDIDADSFSKKLLEMNVTGATIASIVSNAYKKAKDRNHIFEKMDNNIFKKSDMKNVKIIPSDLESAISEWQNKNNKKTSIGYTKSSCVK